MKKRISLILLCFCVLALGFSQDKFTVQNKKHSDKIKFKLINNLIVIPVNINGVTLSFLLDTGVSKPIIFNFLNISDSLKIKNTEKIYLRGLGEGEPVEALRSKGNIIRIGDAIKLKQDLNVVYDVNLNFAPRLGIPVHGIIGFDLFKDLVVEINYTKKILKLTEPPSFKYKNCNKCERLSLEFYKNKPYINGFVEFDNKKIAVKLLIDSGGSDALWLFEDETTGIKSSDKHFNDFLGHGLGGSVYGKRSKIEKFYLNNFKFKTVNVAYPDSVFIHHAKKFRNRSGSMGGNILKRFNIIVDYQKASITLKKNSNFNEEFSYNKSGIELAHDGFRIVREVDDSSLRRNKFSENTEGTNPNSSTILINPAYKLSLKPAYAIVELRENSPAFNAGLKRGDVILRINSTAAYKFSLQKLTRLFYGDEGKHMRLKVDRDGRIITVSFTLKNPF